MHTFVLWFIAVLAVLLTAVVMGWALFEMARKTPERKEYFAALVGLLGTIVGAMVGAAVQELRVQDKQTDAQEAQAVAAQASDAAMVIRTHLDTLTAVLQRTPAGQPIATRDVSTLRAVTRQPSPEVLAVPPTWRRPLARDRLQIR